MSKAGFDFTEIFVLEQSFHNIGKQFPRETGEFLRKQGTELNRQTKKLAKQRVGRNGKGPDKDKIPKKRYINGFKRSAVFKYAADNSYAVRVYNSRPHAHLLEYGHVQLTHEKTPPKTGERFVKGFHMLRDSSDAFEPKFNAGVEEFFENLLDKGLSL